MSTTVAEFINISVRLNQFDFDKVRIAVNEAIKNNEISDIESSEGLDEKAIREIFAKGYYNSPSSNIIQAEEPKVPTTFEEALQYQKDLQAATIKHHEETFQRVLNSLSGDDNSTRATMELSAEITSILEERKQREVHNIEHASRMERVKKIYAKPVQA